MLKIKCVALSVIMLVTLLLFTGCDNLFTKKPCDYDKTKWVCESPYIWFEQNEEKYSEKGVYSYGEASVDGKKIPFYVIYDYSDEVLFLKYPDDGLSVEGATLMTGDGILNLSRTRYTVYVNTEKDEILGNKDRLFGGKYEKLVFFRQDME